MIENKSIAQNLKNSGLDEATGEKEYVMAWQQKACLQAILN